MSEYQYYEFHAIDRPLSARDQAELRTISSRAQITAVSFTNHYDWGDLRASPHTMMERWFDLHVYMGFWSLRTLMIRLPRRLFDAEAARPYAVDSVFDIEDAGDNLILVFHAEELEIDAEEEGSGWAAALAPLRAQLMEGDPRGLYLAWLLGVHQGGVDEDEVEPPRPPGLSRLDGALQAFVEFFEIDPDLLAAAAEGDEPVGDPVTDEALGAFVRALPAAEKDASLLRLLRGEGTVLASELRRRCRVALKGADAGHPPPAERRRVGDLLAASEVFAKERERRKAERAAAERARREREEAEARARRVDGLARRGEAAWRDLEELVEAKAASFYDQAVALLLDLKALAEREGGEAAFRRRVAKIRETHARKRTFIERLDRAGL